MRSKVHVPKRVFVTLVLNKLRCSQRRQATLDDNQLDEDVSASEQEQSGSEGTELDDEDNTMEWSGFDGDNTQPSELPSPSKKYKKNAIPTGEGLRAIKEGEELFKSNTFKLQVCITNYVLYKISHKILD